MLPAPEASGVWNAGQSEHATSERASATPDLGSTHVLRNFRAFNSIPLGIDYSHLYFAIFFDSTDCANFFPLTL